MRIKTAILLLVMVAITSPLTGCFRDGIAPPIYDPGLPPDYPYLGKPGELLVPWEGHYPFYVPFIEEAAMPAVIAENEPSTIELLISAQYRSIVLRGYARNRLSGVFFTEWQDEPALAEDEFAIMPWWGTVDYPRGGVSLRDKASSRSAQQSTEPEYDYEMDLPLLIWEPPGEGEPIDRFIFELPPLPAGKYLVRTRAAEERKWGGIGWYSSEPNRLSGTKQGDPINWLNYADDPIEFDFEVQTEGL